MELSKYFRRNRANSDTVMNLSDSRLLSQTISVLRLPLIVAVVFIHNSSAELPGMDLTEIINQPAFLGGVNNLIIFISGIIAACAVPMFFFFSGYLFFCKVNTFSKEIYYDKVRSRVRSIVVPYLFWALLGVCLYGVLATLPFTKTVYGHGYFSLSWRYIGEQITGFKLVDGEHIYQMGYHLWFLRDLFCMVLISPLFYWGLKDNCWWVTALLGTLWIIGWGIPVLNDYGFNSAAITFFGIGSYFGINHINFVSTFRRISALAYIVYPIAVLMDWLIKTETVLIYSPLKWEEPIHALMILTAVPFWVNITRQLLLKGWVRDIAFWATASFFIYLIHIPFILPQIKKILYHIVQPTSQCSLICLYIFTVLFTCLVALLIYKILMRLFPRFTRVITGGR